MGAFGEEHEMEMWLWENPGAVGVSRWLARQFHTIRGIADLIGEDADGYVVVVEVKDSKTAASDNRAMLQTCWYAAELDALLRMTGQVRTIRKMVVTNKLFPLDLHWAAVALDISLYTLDKVDGGYQVSQHELNNRYSEHLELAVKRIGMITAPAGDGREG